MSQCRLVREASTFAFNSDAEVDCIFPLFGAFPEREVAGGLHQQRVSTFVRAVLFREETGDVDHFAACPLQHVHLQFARREEGH